MPPLGPRGLHLRAARLSEALAALRLRVEHVARHPEHGAVHCIAHCFEARALLLKLACDPAIVRVMRQREWTVGLLAELDPIDDRHAEKLEGEGKRLKGRQGQIL